MGDTIVLRADDPRFGAMTAAGWHVTARSWAAQLDADTVDTARLRRFVARIAPVVVRELAASDLPAVLTLDAATVDDYPGSIATRHTLLTAETARLHGGRRAFGAWTEAGELVGMTFVERDGPEVETAFTVVGAASRGRGVGTAVKAASVLALIQDGVRRFRTGGSADNPAIIAAGASLGYRRDEEWVTLER